MAVSATKSHKTYEFISSFMTPDRVQKYGCASGKLNRKNVAGSTSLRAEP